MRNNLRLYHTVLGQLCQWLPGERLTRRGNLALLVIGLYLGASVQLSAIVSQWPVGGKLPSLTNRLRRFLSNDQVVPARYYEPLAAALLAELAGGTAHLIIDTTKLGQAHRALVVALAYRRRALPLAWRVQRGSRGNTPVTAQLQLLTWVYSLVPSGTSVWVVGDSAFRTGDLLNWLQEHEWHYVIRQRVEVTMRYPDGDWAPIATMAANPGQTRLVGPLWLAHTNPVGPAYLLWHWVKGQAKPWVLVTDQATPQPALRAYRRRMWVEEMIGDMKKHGFNLQATRLAQVTRLERLLLALSIAYVWLVALGSWLVKNGYRHLLDRKNRRDKSYFRLGWDWLDYCGRLDLPIRFRFKPYFSKVIGS